MKIFVIFPLLMLVLVIGMPLSHAQAVPDWVKNTAGWWATDAISETEFVNAITFLVNVGIINTESNDECVNDFLKYFNDREKILQVCEEHVKENQDEIIPYSIEMNYNSKGLRGDEFSERKSENVYRIIMVGGSTMFSAETTNDTTIPGIMQKMFDAENLGKKVEVINAGISGGNSLTELQLIQNKLLGYEPDLIIMMDGWNDLSADWAVNRIINNWEMACGLTFVWNTDLIIVLQPIAGFGNKFLTKQEEISSLTGQDHNGFQLIQAKSTYDYIAREIVLLGNDLKNKEYNACQTFDIREIFDSVSGPIYYDQGHMLQSGNFILAEKFFNLSMQKIDPSYTVDYKYADIISKYNSVPVISYLLDKVGIGDETFQKPLKDTSTIDYKKSRYFELKNIFDGNVDGIFVGKDLRTSNLKEIDLRGHDLTGANLSGHDLREIDLSRTIIRGADLSYTNLEGKDLSGMDLRGIDFSNANLKNANLLDAKFSKSIQFAEPEGICSDEDSILHIIKTWKCAEKVIIQEEIRTTFQNADLTNTQFGSSDLEKAQDLFFIDFSNTNLTDSSFIVTTFAGNDFSNAKLNNIKGNTVFFIASNLEDVKMNNVDLELVWFQNASLINSELKNGIMKDVFMINFDMTGTDLNGTEIENEFEFGENIFRCNNHSICTK